MEYQIQKDGNGQPYIEWAQAAEQDGKLHFKRAWIRHSTKENDWAGVKRYLHVGRVDNGRVNPSPDFPIFSELDDDQLLLAFVVALNGITGCKPLD